MRQCEECSKEARFGFAKNPTHCKDHKTEGMKSANGALCREPTCDKQASFGMPGEKKLKFCASHKEEGMVNHKWKHCEAGPPVCRLTPCYASDKEATCYYHRKLGMACTNEVLAHKQATRLSAYKKKIASGEMKGYMRRNLKNTISAPYF